MGIPFSQTGKSLAEALRTDRVVLTLNSSDAELTRMSLVDVSRAVTDFTIAIGVPGQPEVPSLSHDLDRVLFK